MHNVQVTPLIGLPQLDGWSHVTQNQQGNLVWALSLHGDHARNVGRDVLDMISAHTPTDAADFYAHFQEVVAEAQLKECQFSCAAVFLDGATATFVTYHAQIILRRDTKIGTLLDGLHTTRVVQGSISVDDVYILSTAQAVSFIDEIKLKMKQGYDVDSVVTSLTPNLQLEENTSLAALAFIQVKQRSNEVSEVLGFTQSTVNLDDTSNDRSDESSDENPDDAQMYREQLDAASLKTTEPGSAQENQHTSQTPPVDTHITIDAAGFTKKAGKVIGGVLGLVGRIGKRSSGHVGKLLSKVSNVKNLRVMAKLNELSPMFKTAIHSSIGKFVSKDVYVTKQSSRKIARYIAIGIVIAVLAVGVFIWWAWQRSNVRATVQADLAPLALELETARLAMDDQPIVARDTLVSLQQQVASLKQTYDGKPYALQTISTFAQPIEQLYNEVSGRQELKELPIFHSVTTIEPRFITSAWTLNDETLWLLDDDAKQIIRFNLDSKEGDLFPLEYEGRATAITRYPNSSDALVLTQSGVLRVATQNGAVTKVIDSSSEIEGAKLISTFGTNVYVFNPEKQNIFRFSLEENAFAAPRTWVRSSQGIEYSQVSSLVIDGDIWLSDRAGNIVRMRSGQPQSFSVSGLERAFSTNSIVYTRDDLDFLYVVEPGSNRLVVLAKDGSFVKEIVSTTFASVTSVVVSADGSTAYAISGAVIHEVSL